VFAISVLLALLLVNTALGQQSVIHRRVVGVTDGDTLKASVAGQQLLRVRLAFCDAPEETSCPRRMRFRKGICQRMGQENNDGVQILGYRKNECH
jgi:endonuclease YncB( thermonuclease family)